MLHLSRYYTLHVIVRGMRIQPQYAAKCYKNAGKFFPNVEKLVNSGTVSVPYYNIADSKRSNWP
jgi:hypothetical protein